MSPPSGGPGRWPVVKRALWNGRSPPEVKQLALGRGRSCAGRASSPSPRRCCSPASPMSAAIRARRVSHLLDVHGRRERDPAQAHGRLPGRLRQRGCGGRAPRRLHQLPHARRRDLEVRRGHQCRGGRALEPGLRRRHRRRADRGRRGLRRGRERHPGAHACLRAQVLAAVSSIRARRLQNLARMVEEGFGMSEASSLPARDQPADPRRAHARRHGLQDNVRPGHQHARPAAAAFVRLRRGSAIRRPRTRRRRRSSSAGCPPRARYVIGARAQRDRRRASEKEHRHHPAGWADADRAPRARAAGPGRCATAGAASRCSC